MIDEAQVSGKDVHGQCRDRVGQGRGKTCGVGERVVLFFRCLLSFDKKLNGLKTQKNPEKLTFFVVVSAPFTCGEREGPQT